MQQAAPDEQLAILEDRDLVLINAVSRWARLEGWRLTDKSGRWKYCLLRSQSRKFTPMPKPGDKTLAEPLETRIADPLDFRQVYVKRDGRFLVPYSALAVESL